MRIIEITLGIFAILGIIDCIIGHRFKIGEEFEKGIHTIGSLVFCMCGFLVLSPAIADLLVPLIKPVADFLNIDVSVIAGFFSCDGGGGIMAFDLTDSELWAGYNGLIVGSLFGWMICLIPMALNLTDKKYYDDALSGLLCGIATLPVGCFLGGIMLGTPIIKLIITMLPVIIISAITCVGLVLNPNLCRKIFKLVGDLLNIILYFGVGVGILQKITPVVIIKNIIPIDEAFTTICYIAMLLSGIFPLLYIVSKIFKKPFTVLGKLLKIDETSVMGFITTLANCIPIFAYVGDMNKKGRIMNYAFATSAAFVFGDHLAFALALSANENLSSKYLVAMIVSKLVGGITALIVTQLLYKKLTKEDVSETEKTEETVV